MVFSNNGWYTNLSSLDHKDMAGTVNDTVKVELSVVYIEDGSCFQAPLVGSLCSYATSGQ